MLWGARNVALTEAQLLMLDTLIYTDYCENNDSVEMILNKIEGAIQSGEKINACSMSNEEWLDLVQTIRGQDELLGYTVQEYVNNADTGMRAACFVDNAKNPKDVNVIFRGTQSDYEWHDNGEGAYTIETDQQVAAAEYINKLPEEYGNSMTVSGHSKGGNKAQYVTIVTDRIGRCVSYDGQGFSQEFIDEYADEISQNAYKITSISAEGDFVNCLLFSIAGTKKYIDTDPQKNFLHNHKPNILLDQNGDLWTETDQAEYAKLINEYSIYAVSTLREPERSWTVDGLIALLEKSEGKETALQTIYGINRAAGLLDNFAVNYVLKRGKDFFVSTTGFGGTTIKVPVSSLQENASKMQSFAETNADVFDRLYNSLLCLKGSGEWQGTSLEAIVDATEKNRKKFEETIDELQALATFLDKFVTEISQKDEEIKKQINSVG